MSWFSIVFVFANEYRKSGATYSFKLASNTIKWKLSTILKNIEKLDNKKGLSLRKALRKGNFPPINSDNPTMEKLRLGR
jgi:hypothetical protein